MKKRTISISFFLLLTAFFASAALIGASAPKPEQLSTSPLLPLGAWPTDDAAENAKNLNHDELCDTLKRLRAGLPPVDGCE